MRSQRLRAWVGRAGGGALGDLHRGQTTLNPVACGRILSTHLSLMYDAHLVVLDRDVAKVGSYRTREEDVASSLQEARDLGKADPLYALLASLGDLSLQLRQTENEALDALSIRNSTVVFHRDDGKIYHIRKTTRPEPHQQVLYNALGLPHLPDKTEKTPIDPRAEIGGVFRKPKTKHADRSAFF